MLHNTCLPLSCAVGFLAAVFHLILPAAADAQSPVFSVEEVQAHSIAELYLRPMRQKLFDAFASAPNPRTQGCEESYQSVASKGMIRATLALGYADLSEGEPEYYYGQNLGFNSSLDSAAHKAFVQVLLEPCPSEHNGACGFALESEVGGVSLLTKQVNYAGSQKAIKVVLRITHGSATPYYEQNTGAQAPKQREQSQTAERLYFDELCGSDLSIYAGHSRVSGGPDFRPPILAPATRRVNYGAYSSGPGINRMIRELSQSQCEKPSLIAISSCNSARAFGGRLRQVAPRTGLALTANIDYYDIDLASAFASLDSFLVFRCGEDFNRALRIAAAGKLHSRLSGFAGAQ